MHTLLYLIINKVVFGQSPLIYIHLACGFFIMMCMSMNIDRPSVCDPLGPYISLVNNYIDLIIPY